MPHCKPLFRLLPIASVVAFVLGCQSVDRRAPYPHESVLSAVAELRIFLRLDPYRELPGEDLTGQNIYRATLARLDTLDLTTGAEYADILAFARAECYERLGLWAEAVAQFEATSEAGTSLSEESAARGDWAKKILELQRPPSPTIVARGYANHLDARLLRVEGLRGKAPPYPYDSLLLVLAEDTLAEKALFLFASRFVLPDATEGGVDAAQRLVDEHPLSRRRGEHLLLLGGFYEALARDYATLQDPARGRFDEGPWREWVEMALALYRQASQADGDPAKPEAQARLRTLEAFAMRTERLAQ